MSLYHLNLCASFLCFSYIHVSRGLWIADPYFNLDMCRGWCKPSYVRNVCQLPSYCIYSSLSAYMLSTPAYSHSQYLEIFLPLPLFVCLFLSLFLFATIFIQTALLLKYVNTPYVRAVFKSWVSQSKVQVKPQVKSRLTALATKSQASFCDVRPLWAMQH